MPKVFFSHASEDKEVVEAVYSDFVAAHPEHEPWVDMYEIVGGDSLLDEIAEGMDESERFFIFLSAVSVTKPWVKAELRRALMREIDGVEPGYIVPVKVGDLDAVPAWLEDKLYIDLGRLTRGEWLAAFDAAITGTPAGPAAPGNSPNVNVEIGSDGEGGNVALLRFSTVAWAEKFSFAVLTKKDMAPGESGPTGLMDVLPAPTLALHGPRLVRESRFLGVAFDHPELRPGQPIDVRVEFPPGVDAVNSIESVARWECASTTQRSIRRE